MLLAWMGYRQYFPPLALAQGGRPYSIAEFATDKSERSHVGYHSPLRREPDLELGPRRRRRDSVRSGDEHRLDGEGSRQGSSEGIGEGGYSGPRGRGGPEQFTDRTEYVRE
jgi:hypothetical protein